MAGYEYEDETEKVTWSIVNDIKQVTEDIISSIIGSIQQVSLKKWASVYGDQGCLDIISSDIDILNKFNTGVYEKR